MAKLGRAASGLCVHAVIERSATTMRNDRVGTGWLLSRRRRCTISRVARLRVIPVRPVRSSSLSGDSLGELTIWPMTQPNRIRSLALIGPLEGRRRVTQTAGFPIDPSKMPPAPDVILLIADGDSGAMLF